MLDVVEQALSGSEDSPTSEDTDSRPSKQDSGKEAEDAELSGDPTPDEMKQMQPRTAERIKKLLSERDGYRTEVEQLRTGAEQWDKVERFREAQGLTPTDLANAIQIAGLMRNDPVKAFEILQPVWQNLNMQVGAALSPEMEQAVRAGDLRREHALQMTRTQAEADRATRRLQEQQRVDAERQQQANIQAQTTSLQNAANDWEQRQMAKDPDFDLKRSLIAEKADLAMRRLGKFPESPEAMVQILDTAKKEVEATLSAFRPSPRAISPNQAGVSPRASNGSAPKPTSHLEALEAALNM